MITYALAAKLFEGFSILRWNDRLRPVELIEMDHHALKSIVTYFLGKAAESSPKHKISIDWRNIVDGNVYDLLGKITTSDIHAEVRKRLKKKAGDVFAKNIMDDWSKPALNLGTDFGKDEKFERYIRATPEKKSVQFYILRYAHKYASLCEFDIVQLFSLDKGDNKRIKNEIEDSMRKVIQSSFDSIASDLLDEDESDIRNVFRIIERLRYQIRWSQTPRIPSTSVLGHCMYSAVLAYFISIEAGLNDERIANNFYAALFHDMPEALSRDIISPVKKADKKIQEVVEEIERKMCEDKIFKKIPEAWRDDFRFITGQMCLNGKNNLIREQLDGSDPDKDKQIKEFKDHGEFSNRIKTDKAKYEIIPWGKDKDNSEPYKETMDGYFDKNGIDGKILKICDGISAYMEARMSIQHGIRSPHLDNGIASTISDCRGTHLYKLKVDDFFDSITF
jgi:putative hydrolase of HD superfamily